MRFFGVKLGIILIFLTGLVAACQESVTRNEGARILAVGDSLMAWNSAWGSSIPHVMEDVLGEAVVDRSVRGAWMTVRDPNNTKGGINIPNQYVAGDWDWVVVNGGGNDLLFGCGCGRCSGMLDRMISKDGMSGQIPTFARRVRDDGARVLFTGYLRSPGLLTPIEHCKSAGDELEARLIKLASQEDGVIFVSNKDVVPSGGITYFSPDLIHPSRKSSRIIGRKLASVITQFDNR
ncbi:hypothetical protein TRL7639_03311 [Falsiruegeria litorea R37]|uniref:SGNH hydrolase-type esterase domain-containing protein n=1 Tax=Falsiruegeria litorea R37 TaxID=1200284 RepID=A0A1Y5TB76_9RHOB|nr:hypothetical protein TRL7639_03311 [Falsiruegeria litorea R37]